jgi:hypothetical protein
MTGLGLGVGQNPVYEHINSFSVPVIFKSTYDYFRPHKVFMSLVL